MIKYYCDRCQQEATRLYNVVIKGDEEKVSRKHDAALCRACTGLLRRFLTDNTIDLRAEFEHPLDRARAESTSHVHKYDVMGVCRFIPFGEYVECGHKSGETRKPHGTKGHTCDNECYNYPGVYDRT